MILAARELIEAAFTVSAVNTQITAVNTAYGVTGTALAAVQDGWLNAPKDGSSYPLLTYWVGDGTMRSEMKRQGKRDTAIAVKMLVLSRHATLAESEEDIEVTLEALQTVLETLRGQQYGSTRRYCVETLDPAMAFVEFNLGGEVMRHGGELTFTMLMRTEGV